MYSMRGHLIFDTFLEGILDYYSFGIVYIFTFMQVTSQTEHS